MDLVVEIYGLTKVFPHDEQWGLTSQIRRAAVSVPSNIAEGNGRLHRPEYLHFLSIARGSLTEVETQLQIAFRLGYVARERARAVWMLTQQTGRLLNGLIRALEAMAHIKAGSNRPPTVAEEPADYVLLEADDSIWNANWEGNEDDPFTDLQLPSDPRPPTPDPQ